MHTGMVKNVSGQRALRVPMLARLEMRTHSAFAKCMCVAIAQAGAEFVVGPISCRAHSMLCAHAAV